LSDATWEFGPGANIKPCLSGVFARRLFKAKYCWCETPMRKHFPYLTVQIFF